MKLLIKQKFFSIGDSYDVFDESGNVMFTVKSVFDFGHHFRIFDAIGYEVGSIRQKMLSWKTRFDMFIGDEYKGCITKEFTFFRPSFKIDYIGWQIEGNWLEWDYTIVDPSCMSVARVSKEIRNWTDTYVIDVYDSTNVVYALMLVLAIDAEKDTRN